MQLNEELKDAIKENRMVVLPVAIGTPVYKIMKRCKSRSCPFNGGYGEDRCNKEFFDNKLIVFKDNSSQWKCHDIILKVPFSLDLLTELDKTVFIDLNDAKNVICKCDCFEEITEKSHISDFQRGMYYALTGSIPPDLIEHVKTICNGTRECDECSCGGDRRNCTFYEEIRERYNNI